ncbi:MAG: DUF3634 family protein [Myxococcota bacterium]|nr:DUF3634 family protein [Myxococcota bacterium]
MDVIVFLIIVAGLVFAGVAVFGRSDAFLIRISAGGARRRRGNPPRGFVDDCGDIVRARKLKTGEIRGIRKRGRIKLQFSDDIAGHHQQPFRNAFALRTKQ